MKTILIVLVLQGIPAVSWIEFDDLKSCENAAAELQKITSGVRTLCIAKGER